MVENIRPGKTDSFTLKVLGGERLIRLLQRRKEQHYFTVPWPVSEYDTCPTTRLTTSGGEERRTYMLTTLALLLTEQGDYLTTESGQRILVVVPDEYEWTPTRDRTFAWAVIDLFQRGAIGSQDFFDMTAAFRKKK